MSSRCEHMSIAPEYGQPEADEDKGQRAQEHGERGHVSQQPGSHVLGDWYLLEGNFQLLLSGAVIGRGILIHPSVFNKFNRCLFRQSLLIRLKELLEHLHASCVLYPTACENSY